MKNNQSINKILDQTAELIGVLKDNASKPRKSISPEIRNKLINLEMMVRAFNEVTKKEIEKTGVSKEQLKKTLQEGGKHLPESEKKVFDKAKRLSEETMALQLGYLTAVSDSKNKADKPFSKARDMDKKNIQKRKGKFKKMGGDQTWKKL